MQTRSPSDTTLDFIKKVKVGSLIARQEHNHGIVLRVDKDSQNRTWLVVWWLHGRAPRELLDEMSLNQPIVQLLALTLVFFGWKIVG